MGLHVEVGYTRVWSAKVVLVRERFPLSQYTYVLSGRIDQFEARRLILRDKFESPPVATLRCPSLHRGGDYSQKFGLHCHKFPRDDRLD